VTRTPRLARFLELWLVAVSGCHSAGSGDGGSDRQGPPDSAVVDAATSDVQTPSRDAGGAEASCLVGAEAGPIPDAAPYATLVPRVNEVTFYSELASKRPDLLAYPPDGGSGTASLCYQSMILAPNYRGELLDGGASVLPSAIEVESSADRAADDSWIAEEQSDELAYCAMHPGGGCSAICASGGCTACPDASVGSKTAPLAPYWVSGYGLCAFVGYEVGPDVPIYDEDGLVWLVYFTFESLDEDLTPALMHSYAEALACSGYQGDFKILTDPALPQQGRYQYNDIIVHGHSEHDAELAEAIGLNLFVSRGKTLLAATGRGLDVHNVQVGAYEQYLVWAEYLCAEHGDLSIAQARSPHAVPYTLYEE
jgi:hypothetical protein